MLCGSGESAGIVFDLIDGFVYGFIHLKFNISESNYVVMMGFALVMDVDVFYNLSFELVRIPVVGRPELE